MSRSDWTKEEDSTLKTCVRNRMSASQTAAVLKTRSENAVYSRMKKLGIHSERVDYSKEEIARRSQTAEAHKARLIKADERFQRAMRIAIECDKERDRSRTGLSGIAHIKV